MVVCVNITPSSSSLFPKLSPDRAAALIIEHAQKSRRRIKTLPFFVQAPNQASAFQSPFNERLRLIIICKQARQAYPHHQWVFVAMNVISGSCENYKEANLLIILPHHPNGFRGKLFFLHPCHVLSWRKDKKRDRMLSTRPLITVR